MNAELSHSYDIRNMFIHDLSSYGEPIRKEGDNDAFRQLPYRFLGLFNYCFNLNIPSIKNKTGLFRIVILPRSYVYYTELERFF